MTRSTFYKSIFRKGILGFILIFSVGLLTLSAQTHQIRFRVYSMIDFKPIHLVKVSLKGQAKFVPVFSDDQGLLSLSIKESDTLMFEKSYYHPLKMVLDHDNFDTEHIIEISLVPSPQEKVLMPKANLMLFEYHFVHDTLGEKSKVHIKGFEHPDASKVRYGKDDQSFHVVDVPIDHISIGHSKQSKSRYLKANP